jgi:type III restriction enzyme
MSHLHEVEQPIICDAYREPTEHWRIEPGQRPQRLPGRRLACYYYRPPAAQEAAEGGDEFGTPVPLELANRIRAAVRAWREAGYPGCGRVTLDLLAYWNDPERDRPLFFCQREAAESIIFLVEGRRDLLQGIAVPLDEPGPEGLAAGYRAFRRYACKMATGTGKTTVMAMLIAWSVLNKVADRNDKRFSDTVLVVCPNVTIRDQLRRQLDPNQQEASLYRARDLVPASLMDQLRRGRILVTNWHAFNPRDLNRVGNDTGKVVKRGPESDEALIGRVLGDLDETAVDRRNILVINDEAHHAYRRGTAQENGGEEEDDRDEIARRNAEATVWIGGLDKLHKQRGINFCVDLSATPFYLVGSGNPPGRPFPWVVSDFGLIDAIESGIVKIPQLPVADSTGAPIPYYFNVWKTIMSQLSSAERGGRRGKIKPEAILRHAKTPLVQLAGLWRQTFEDWQASGREVPPVFIVVCRDTALAQEVYAWISSGGAAPEFANEPGREYTVRIDSKVVESLESGVAKNDEEARLRDVLATVGKPVWPDGRPPEEWVNLCTRWNAHAREEGGTLLDPAVPPGKDVRCIVSVAMLTEGWDAANVTHIAGLRPFESQLLCEQVVGRGLRRTQYHDLKSEEVAQVYGVPFELIPFKARPDKVQAPPRVHHVYALKDRAQFEIRFPRVEDYTVAIKARIRIDWDRVPVLRIEPGRTYPDMTRLKGLSDERSGRLAAWGPGQPTDVDLIGWRQTRWLQMLEFELATELVSRFAGGPTPPIAPQVLFPQVLAAVKKYLREKVQLQGRADRLDVFLEPNWSRAVDALLTAIVPDELQEELPELPVYERHRGPGSTADIDFWTSREIRATETSHVNALVADTEKWEQSAAFYLETSPLVRCYVKNDHLGFAIPYLWKHERHDYVPDLLVRLTGGDRDLGTLILEVKGGRDERAEEKAAGAKRWVAAVNNDSSERACGRWVYRMVRNPADVPDAVADAFRELQSLCERGAASEQRRAV